MPQPSQPGRPRGRSAPKRSSKPVDPPSKLDVPTGAREPIGRDRAQRRQDAPPRRSRAEVAAPPRPELPTDEEPVLPRSVLREIERTLGKGRKSKDIALGLSIGAAAIDEGRSDVAVEVLAWVKYEAPRISAVREAYGVALYLDEQYAAALSELQAYRRFTGQDDQNHLIADCLRALGRGIDQIAAAAEALLADQQAPEDRRAEAAIVWAAALADAGDVGAGRSILRRFLERARSSDSEHDLRVRYVAAELARDAGDAAESQRQLDLIRAVDPSFLDAADEEA